jgi:hypothetical protein
MKVKAFFMLGLPRVLGLILEDRSASESGLTDHPQVVELGQLFLHCSNYEGTFCFRQRRRAPTLL